MITHGKDIKIFSAGSNSALASKIAEELTLLMNAKEDKEKIKISVGNSEVTQFSDGETSISIYDSVRGSDVFVVQSTSAPVNETLMRLLIMIDAFKRASAGRITAVIPYFGYARQDRKAKPRDPISAKLVADIITKAGADRVLTMDLHAPQIQGFFDIPLDHLYGAPILAPYFIQLFSGKMENIVIVSPDLGSVTRAREFAQRCNTTLALIDKRRARANVSEVCNIIGDVAGKTCILVDDMIDTAGTICNAAKALLEVGGATEVYACATHGVLSGEAINRFKNSPMKEIVLLDTICIPQEKILPNFRILSTAKMFAGAIQRIYGDLPMATLQNS